MPPNLHPHLPVATPAPSVPGPTIAASAEAPDHGSRRDPLARHPVAVGVLATLALVGAFVLSQAAAGMHPFGAGGSVRDFRIGLLHCALAVYLPLAYAGVRRRAAATDRSVHREPTAADPLAPSAGAASPSVIVALALLGLVGAFFGPSLMEPEVGGVLHWWRPSSWNAATVWHRLLGLWIGPWEVLFCYAIVVVSLRLARLGRALTLRDVFDRGPLAPIVPPALTNALLSLGVLSLYSAFAVDFGAARPVLVNGALSLVLAGVALLLPASGVRARVRAAKQAELAWCDAEVTRARRALRSGAAADGRLADAAAYRALVERVSEWPFDNPALRRISLYLLLPVGSWVASTVVQHAVERYVFRQ